MCNASSSTRRLCCNVRICCTHTMCMWRKKQLNLQLKITWVIRFGLDQKHGAYGRSKALLYAAASIVVWQNHCHELLRWQRPNDFTWRNMGEKQEWCHNYPRTEEVCVRQSNKNQITTINHRESFNEIVQERKRVLLLLE